MPTFIGLDLAWTNKNDSGICWLEGDSRENLNCTRLEVAPRGTVSLAEEVAAANPAVVTIDAPVLYTPDRWAENEIARRFNKYKCPAHSSHMAYANGFTAGIDLGRALEERGFSCNPEPLLQGKEPERSAIEVYPHTLHVRLFGLSERLPYKRKKGRDTPFLRRAMQQYQRHLRALIERECPQVLQHHEVQHALDSATAQRVMGRSLKRLDDALDGLTCALAAWLMWDRPEQWEALGDASGYIVVPVESVKPVQTTSDLPDSPLDPTTLIRSGAPGVEVQVSKSRDKSTWEIRVRLEGDDLSRVITVVERLE